VKTLATLLEPEQAPTPVEEPPTEGS